MQTNNHQIKDYSQVLEERYGKEGSQQRNDFDEKAYAFYTAQLLTMARKEAKISQKELSKRTNIPVAVISEFESGEEQPTAAKFYYIISSLGMKIEIVKPLATI